MLLRLLRRLLLMLSRHRGGTASGLWTTASPLAVWERARARSPELAALHTVCERRSGASRWCSAGCWKNR